MARKTLKAQIIAGLSTTLLLGLLATGQVIAREEVNNTTTEPNTTAVTSVSETEGSIVLKPATIYQTLDVTFNEVINQDNLDWKNFTWTFGNEKHGVKPIAEWQVWDSKKHSGFEGGEYISVEGEGKNLKVTFNAQFGIQVDQRRRKNARRTYRNYIGEYELKGVSADGKTTITKKINLRPYESFKTHDEMLASIAQTEKMAAKNRQVTLETIGTSAQNREIKMGIIAENQAAIDEYLSKTSPAMLKTPDEVLKALEKGDFNYRIPILINNTHADEQPAIDIITDLFREFATKDKIKFKTLVGEGTEKANLKEQDVELDLQQLLKRFIFLFDFTENPDGDVMNTRALANGMDPNRDTGYQTNPETRAIVTQINKWNPLALLDIHGFVSEFLVEPSTPPHDPNFEYDLLGKSALANAHAIGNAGIANSTYDSYLIPMLEFLKGEDGNPDYRLGWDDSSSGYTGVYGLYHGILGHTMEIPATNQDSYHAGFYGVLGSIHYLDQNRDQLFGNKVKIFSRGVNKVEAPETDATLVDPSNKVVGRDKKGQKQFFPDYYVIPLEISGTNDVDQAFSMVEYFKRNGVEVKELTKDTGEYKKGDLVIDMAQAKRGYANHILYRGTDLSVWEAMYAEVTANFPDMRGFKAVPIFDAKAFDGMLGEVTQKQAPRITIDKAAPYYFVSNNSLSVVQTVNKLIHAGHDVYTAEDGYIMSKADFEAALAEHSLYGSPLYKKPVGEKLTALKVYAPGNPNIGLGFPSKAEVNNALKQMGFDTVDSIDEADVVILDNDQYEADVLGKKPTLIMGGAVDRLEELHVIQGFDAEHSDEGPYYNNYEGLLNVTVDDTNPLASGYLKDDLLYSRSGAWIEGVPEGFKPVVKAKDKDYYIAGWWAGHDKVAGKVLAIDGKYKDQPLFIYAGNPTNKLHTLHFYRWVSNLLLNKEHAQLVDIYQPNNEAHNATWLFDRDANQWQYVKADGTKAQNEWILDKGQWYFIKEDTFMARNEWSGKYYLRGDGTMAMNEWIYDSKVSSWFYLKADGRHANEEWFRYNGAWYYLKADGKMAMNEWSGNYYLRADGIMAMNEWVYDSTYSSWFYLKADGRYANEEWLYYNGAWYYLKAGGYMAKNEWIGDYYLKDSGMMASSEWVYDSIYSSWFYLKADGRYANKEWFYYNGAWYYLKAGGYMAKNEWLWDNGKCYYLKEDGRMAMNEVIQGYRVNASGEWVR